MYGIFFWHVYLPSWGGDVLLVVQKGLSKFDFETWIMDCIFYIL